MYFQIKVTAKLIDAISISSRGIKKTKDFCLTSIFNLHIYCMRDREATQEKMFLTSWEFWFNNLQGLTLHCKMDFIARSEFFFSQRIHNDWANHLVSTRLKQQFNPITWQDRHIRRAIRFTGKNKNINKLRSHLSVLCSIETFSVQLWLAKP